MSKSNQLFADALMPIRVGVVRMVLLLSSTIPPRVAVLIFTEFVDEVPQLLTVCLGSIVVQVVRDFLTENRIHALPVLVDVIHHDGEQSDEDRMVVQHAQDSMANLWKSSGFDDPLVVPDFLQE